MRLRTRRSASLLAIALLFVGSMVVASVSLRSPALAVTGSQWRAGNIIDDFVFFNKDSMSVQQIQDFLEAKVPVCDRNHPSSNPSYQPPYTCLKEYQENTTTGESNYGRFNPDGTPLQITGAKSAAQIIWEEAQTYSINPQTLLVMLQKEQSLITDDWPWLVQYQKAMGQACPDTAPCDPAFAGFYHQVSGAAWQLRHYVNNPQFFNYRAGVTRNVLFNPNAACGSTSVYIENAATAALYNYTPYQPNQAALNNLYGTGDSCSAYGNRNFWRLFNDWFGTTLADDTNSAHPNGTLILENGSVYLVEGTKKRYVSYKAFLAHRFDWTKVEKATTGDGALETGTNLEPYRAGTLFKTSASSPVYVADYESGTLVKRHVSYDAFMFFKYRWDDVLMLNPVDTPAQTATAILTRDKHPSGNLVYFPNDPKVYLIDQATKRHVLNGFAFLSYGYRWDEVSLGTSADKLLADGLPVEAKVGSIAHANGGIYVVDADATGPLKRPLGPWNCFSRQLHYDVSDLYYTSIGSLPVRTGPLFTC